MSNRVLIYRIGSPPKMKAVVFWTSPSVNNVEISEAIKSFSEIEGPVESICLLTWHHCQAVYDELLKSPLDLRVNAQFVSGAILHRNLSWGTHSLRSAQISEILASGYEILMNRRGGVLVAPEGYHYEKLSGIHSRKFLRAANVFINSNESALFAIGVLTRLRLSEPPDIVYTDTSAINMVGHIISDFYLSKNGIPSPIPVVSFGSYEGLERGFAFDFKETAVVVMSATTSGSLEKLLVVKHELPKDRICTLFAANVLTDIDVLFNISDSKQEPLGTIDNYRIGACPMCDNDEPVIKISGDQFLPEPANCRPFEILNTTLSDSSRRFVNDLDNGKVSCNFRRLDNLRQTFYFNLFSGQDSQVEHEIKRLFGLMYGNKKATILVPVQTENLGWTQGSDINITCTERLDDVKGLSAVSVFCPVNYDSGTQSSLGLDLRTQGGDRPLSFLLGVSVYSGKDEQKATMSTLKFRKTGWSYLVESVYDIYLPAARTEKTSWDFEQQWWMNNKLLISNLQPVNDRLRKLTSDRTLDNGDVLLPDFLDKPLVSTAGFAFFDRKERIGDQASIMLTMSLALHDRRSGKGSWSTPHNREVIEPRMFNRFSDPAIQGAILRCALPEELNYSGDQQLSRRFLQIVQAMVAAKGIGNGAALSEFCYAILSQRVRLNGHEHRKILQTIAELSNWESAWAKAFGAIAKKQLT